MTRLSWSNPTVRGVVYQALALAAVAGAVAWLVANTLANLQALNIASGFGFLSSQAGFAIGETPIAYGPQDTYARAILVGLLNTLRVAAAGILLATVLGTLIGIARLSSNWLVSRLAAGYVEVMRNIPLLLHLFFWYALITETMPGPREALRLLPGVFMSNRGVTLPTPTSHVAFDYAAAAFLLAIVVVLALAHRARQRQDATGRRPSVLVPALLLLIGLPVAGWALGGAPLALEIPELRGFAFVGGATLSPEYAALLLGLVIYTAGFIAEVVRSGIQSIGHGQWEAAHAIGLRRGRTLRLVILPQALRVIVPPMTNQYLNITKNSSLAVAIGYPDLVSVTNTTLNQTGQAVEGILIVMAAYLSISLTISLLMNVYHRRIAMTSR